MNLKKIDKKLTKPPMVASKTTKLNKASPYIGLILTSIILLINLIGIYVVISKISQIAKQTQKIRTQVIASKMSNQDELLLKQAVDENWSSYQKMQKSLPDSETSLLRFMNLVDDLRNHKIATISGDITVRQFSVDSDVPTKIGHSQSFLPVTLILSGEENTIMQALQYLVNSIYFIRVINLNEEFDPVTDQMRLQTQFHLFVADNFGKN